MKQRAGRGEEEKYERKIGKKREGRRKAEGRREEN